jgi:uncharacterized protein
LDALLDTHAPVGLPWLSLLAFQRVITNPRSCAAALTPDEAWRWVVDWRQDPVTWIPEPGPRYGDILGELIERYQPRVNLVTDVALAALVIEHDALLYSADNDFARFREVRWENPLGG